MAEARELVQPAAAWDAFPIRSSGTNGWYWPMEPRSAGGRWPRWSPGPLKGPSGSAQPERRSASVSPNTSGTGSVCGPCSSTISARGRWTRCASRCAAPSRPMRRPRLARQRLALARRIGVVGRQAVGDLLAVGHPPDWGRFERVDGDVADQVALADRRHRPGPAGGRGRQQLRFLHDPRALHASPFARSLDVNWLDVG